MFEELRAALIQWKCDVEYAARTAPSNWSIRAAKDAAAKVNELIPKLDALEKSHIEVTTENVALHAKQGAAEHSEKQYEADLGALARKKVVPGKGRINLEAAHV